MMREEITEKWDKENRWEIWLVSFYITPTPYWLFEAKIRFISMFDYNHNNMFDVPLHFFNLSISFVCMQLYDQVFIYNK